jgi:hypothetical protein
MNIVQGQDAAYADDIVLPTTVVFGYFGGPNAYHVWPRSDWSRFTENYKVPIWVAGYNGAIEGHEAVAELETLGVPKGCVIVLDMEERKDETYVISFGHILHDAGYKVAIYGSASSVFGNPPLNGYWVADWTGESFMYQHPQVRWTQYAEGPGHDNDAIKAWTLRELWR